MTAIYIISFMGLVAIVYFVLSYRNIVKEREHLRKIYLEQAEKTDNQFEKSAYHILANAKDLSDIGMADVMFSLAKMDRKWSFDKAVETSL